jgi:hypothetical protein
LVTAGSPACRSEGTSECGENGDALLRLEESGVIGVPRDRCDLGRLDVDTPSADCLRCGVDICPGHTRDETVRERRLSEEGARDVSVLLDKVGLIVVDSLGLFSSSPSFHCKLRITDLMAHWLGGNEWRRTKKEGGRGKREEGRRKRNAYGHLRALCREPL